MSKEESKESQKGILDSIIEMISARAVSGVMRRLCSLSLDSSWPC
jgi:hypothetical protein